MTSINNFVLKNFILDKVGYSLDLQEARNLGIDGVYNKVANELDVDDGFEIDDILYNDKLYEQFATLYVTETEEKEETINKEKEEEKLKKVQDKNGAGV